MPKEPMDLKQLFATLRVDSSVSFVNANDEFMILSFTHVSYTVVSRDGTLQNQHFERRTVQKLRQRDQSPSGSLQNNSSQVCLTVYDSALKALRACRCIRDRARDTLIDLFLQRIHMNDHCCRKKNCSLNELQTGMSRYPVKYHRNRICTHDEVMH